MGREEAKDPRAGKESDMFRKQGQEGAQPLLCKFFSYLCFNVSNL